MMNTTENNNNINNNGQLQVFQNEAFGQVRVIMKENEPWFVGKEIAELLGYKNPLRAIREHIKDNHKGVNEMVTPGGKQQIIIIDEAGFYSLVLRSKLPSAEAFQEWVTSEVLPTIRKHKMYLTPETAQEAVEDPGVFLAKAMLVANDVIEQQKTKIIEQRQEILKLAPKAKKYDKYMKAEDSYTISDVAIMNGLAPDKLFNYLKSLGWLRKPYRGAHELTEEAPTGYFKVIRTFFNGCVRGTQIRVTVEGYRNISNLLSAIKAM